MLKKSNGYREMMRALGTMTETDIEQAIAVELATERRLSVIERLHQRLCMLRYRRERAELLKGLT
jgi:hypothetical protein